MRQNPCPYARPKPVRKGRFSDQSRKGTMMTNKRSIIRAQTQYLNISDEQHTLDECHDPLVADQSG